MQQEFLHNIKAHKFTIYYAISGNLLLITCNCLLCTWNNNIRRKTRCTLRRFCVSICVCVCRVGIIQLMEYQLSQWLHEVLALCAPLMFPSPSPLPLPLPLSLGVNLNGVRIKIVYNKNNTIFGMWYLFHFAMITNGKYSVNFLLR